MSAKEKMVLNRVKAGHSWLTHEHHLSRKSPPICDRCKGPLTMQHIFQCLHPHAVSSRYRHSIDSLEEAIKPSCFQLSKGLNWLLQPDLI